jgi:hypothetical protein
MMATLYIAEITQLGRDAHGQSIMSPVMNDSVIESVVAIGGSSAQSNAFATSTRFVQIHCDAICSVRFGANPTATTSNGRMAANETRFVAINPGDRVAVIANT